MKPKPNFKLGDLVVIKSYAVTNSLVTGDPLHVQPIMVVTGIEIENKNKKTHDNEIGEQIAERIKYYVMWFDNAKSCFIEKVIYESFILKLKHKALTKFSYVYGGVTTFKTSSIEIEKQKESKSKIVTEYEAAANTDKNNTRELETMSPLMTFVCPDLVCSGIKMNETKSTFDDKGEVKTQTPEKLIKVMWFNPNQQKYSEENIPMECLTKKKVKT